MRTLAIVAVCGLLAGCSQTAVSNETTPAGHSQSRQVADKPDACDAAIRKQANSAMLGSALGMAGGFGGFGGQGGMVAAQVASTAGSMVARSQAAEAQAAVMRDCQRARS